MVGFSAARVLVPLAVSQLFTSVFAQDITEASGTPSSEISSATATGASASESSPSSTPTGEPKVHLIKAGAGGFKFTPDEITDAAVGDIITFEFYPPDHSVARAEFGSACVPYEYTGRNKTGFWSTTQWVDDVDEITHWNLTINSTEPIFFYCAAPNSCTTEHMVGAINPNSSQTLDAQKRSARQASFQVAPGEEIPSEASSTLLEPSGTGAPSSGGSNSDGGSDLSGGAIAGIVVGAVAFLVICAALFFYVGRTKSLKDMMKRKDATIKTNHDQPDYSHYGAPSPGPAGGPFSPAHNSADYGNLPPYGQHNATEQHPSGWTSPTMQHPNHMSMMSNSSMQQQMSEMKFNHNGSGMAEMPSPPPQQQTFTHELEAPIKSPR